MKDKIAWILLSAKHRTNEKMRKIAKDFETKKHTADLNGEQAAVIRNDILAAKNIGAEIITYIDSEYPEELKNIAYPPPYLYLRGDKSLLEYPIKATVVGSREATLYGINTASNFAFELASNNVLIVSGGARGIDTAAIDGALKAGGRVIVVIGTGIDIDYPHENAKLFNKVVNSGGLIISEFPVGTGPFGQNFPVRNRIMTALGDCLIVVEAGEKSGALISATHATDQGKTVFAVPGNIDSPTSVGTNALIRDGATIATSGGDVLFYLMEKECDKYRAAKEYEYTEKEDLKEEALIEEDKKADIGIKENLSAAETAVVNAIKMGKNTYDEILDFCACEPNKLTSLLTIMEIKGIIKLAFGNRYKMND